jgi:hypothetical protein
LAALYNKQEDYQYVETKAHEQNKPFFEGAAIVMKASNFQYLVDMFGDVPYTDALQGTAKLLPGYDDAQTIYTDLIEKINAGMELIKTSGGSGATANNDIMFHGDFEAWLKFANTLKLRILMRQSEISGRDTYIKSKIAEIVAEGSGFLDFDATVNPGFLNTTGKQSPFYGYNKTPSGGDNNDYFVANQFAIDFYNANDDAASDYDPRGRRIYDPNNFDGTYTGNQLGLPGAVQAKVSFFGPGVVSSYDQDAVVFTAAESFFLQAEAAARGWLTADAEELYHLGIEASFHTYGVASASSAAADYYNNQANTKVYWDPAASLATHLNLLITQKWAAENTVTPFEVWADYRRLPNLAFNKSIPLTQSTNVDVLAVPVRLLYPTIEYQNNSANVTAQNQAPTAHHTDKIFWMP